MKKHITYELYLNFDQAYEFGEQMLITNGDISTVLRNIGRNLRDDYYSLLDLARRIEDYRSELPDENIEVETDNYQIAFTGPDEFLEELHKRGLLHKARERVSPSE